MDTRFTAIEVGKRMRPSSSPSSHRIMGLRVGQRLRNMKTMLRAIDQNGAACRVAPPASGKATPEQGGSMRYAKTGVSQVLLSSARVKCRRSVRALGCSLVALVLSLSSARADVVADWTQIALHTVIASEQGPARAARELATVYIAIFESMNFIEGLYVPQFVVKQLQPSMISSEAAAAAAAHYVLVQLHPEESDALDAALRQSAAAIPEAEGRSSALVAGRSLGANIYAIWVSELRPASSNTRSKASRVHVSTRGSGANAVAWYWIVAQFIQAQHLGPIESARLYALVSIALRDLYDGVNRDAALLHGSEHPCVSCASGAAVQVILESESGSAGIPGMGRINPGAIGAAYASSHVREYGRGLSSELPSPTSIEAGEKVGRTIGLRALANYRPSGNR